MTTLLMRNRASNILADEPEMLRNRSVFPFEKSRKQTCKAAFLTPIFYEEVIPGDTWNINMNYVIQMLPQITAPKDNLWVSTFYFYDPYRLVWKNFGKMMGAKEKPEDHNDYIAPAIIAPEGGFATKSLSRYLEKPALVNTKTNAYPERIYNHVYNEYFRSSILQDPVYFSDGDEDDDASNYDFLRITKAHDYFTDCLPTLQQGDPVKLPLGTEAPVYGNDALRLVPANQVNNTNGATDFGYLRTGANNSGTGSGSNYNTNLEINSRGSTNYPDNALSAVMGKNGVNGLKQISGLYADLSEAISADIAALRLMIATQSILEADNRSGIRYTEILQSRYGCINPDLQLYRPQYLGGTRTPLFTTPVIQTSATGTGETVQGNMSGLGQTNDGGNVIKASFGEFGAIIGIMAITTIPQYQNTCPKKHKRFERFDYFHPEFQLISDEAVYNYEIFCQDDEILDETTGESINDQVWGYNRRYESLRRSNNIICGELMSQDEHTLDVWHYAEKFNNLPNLNGEFLEDKSDITIKRTMAIQLDENNETESQFIVDISHTGEVTRGLVANPIPQTGGRII